ncbi:3-phosphoshikimate 1-carboxyvinyltransferase [Croceiramulus getboli]|nr:3-phosphoshikimate 1-carboxyvinyltransferase [Flavobacteriaceae bacterium YJPT1-3]
MTIQLSKANAQLSGSLQITGSKSESNRLLILQALYPNLTIENLSNSDDSKVMAQALSASSKLVDIHHAGTAMRFLTAYFATNKGADKILTGSARMQQRPIEVLVKALRELGATIEYQHQEGYPPLLIKGSTLSRKQVALQATISSQYISALMLIGASMPEGLTIDLVGKLTSVPYIQMTQELLNRIGINCAFKGNQIVIEPLEQIKDQTVTVESDWSSASYFYALVALSDDGQVTLGSYRKQSLQGDSVLAEIYRDLGVTTTFEQDTITLRQQSHLRKEHLKINLRDAPDIAQTIAVSCLGLGLSCELTGLHTLKIKETDRLVALQQEISKLGGAIEVTDDSLHLHKSPLLKENVSIATYQDHRMAMAFAPLAIKVPIAIEEAEVVSKSYPEFWNDLTHLGLEIKTL